MFCINCFNHSTNVINSRPKQKRPLVWRRRKCPKCSAVFTTEERPALSNITVDLGNGSLSEFNSGRIIISIAEAFTHNQDEGRKNAQWLAQTVEESLATQHQTAISVNDIAATVHAVLKRYDELAALQYAARHQLVSTIRRRGRPSLRGHEQPTRE